MSESAEYGGYMELQCAGFEKYHKSGVYLNSARNALRHIVRAHQIKKIYIPYFTCPVVWQALEEEGCEIIFYDINFALEPDLKGVNEDEYVVVNNYFGVTSLAISKLNNTYRNIIVDNAQAFYSEPKGIASFYSPRKFFGLPDGGIAITKRLIDGEYEKDSSYDRCSHLLKRLDLGANPGYADFVKNDSGLGGQSIKMMSNLTHALMGNIDYMDAKKKRQRNYGILDKELFSFNDLKVRSSNMDVPLAYPLLIEDKQLRKDLIDNKIYVAKYWPGVDEVAPPSSVSRYMQEYLHAIPIDQRYDEKDMLEIAKRIQKVLSRG